MVRLLAVPSSLPQIFLIWMPRLLTIFLATVDVCITTPLKKLESMHNLAATLHKSTFSLPWPPLPPGALSQSPGTDDPSADGMEKVVCRASAKVPIVKIWDPELQLACDLNVNNPLALENTRMIKTYVQMDDRVRPLAKIIKYWTKQRLLNDAGKHTPPPSLFSLFDFVVLTQPKAFGGTISSYTWICMIINFLQIRRPPILPSLQKIPDNRSTSATGESSSFADDVDKLRGYGDDNKESLGQLLFHFFRHYGYVIDYAESVISVKEGRLLPRKEKGWDASNWAHNKEARMSLCVEEPFNTPRNLGNSADDYAWNGIHKEIRRAFDLLQDGQNLDKCCEQYEFPPEEKPSTLFQRPTAKPPPVLRRSASQSGRPNNGTGQVRVSNPRTGRNTSNQRSNNRRASSGASYANQRAPYLMSPPIGVNPADYFSNSRMSTDQLHDQLYKQYQYLQAQQEALRSQLMQQQQQTQAQIHAQAQAQVQAQAQAQAQARSIDTGASPRQQRPSFVNVHSTPQTPRILDNGSSTVPLLPGSLYHYPARYPQGAPSPLAQSRTSEEAVAAPSSPPLASATPTLRRGVHRGSVNDNGSSSTRSQSQPGRSFPNVLTLQGLVHPGYDVSGALGTPYLVSRPAHAFPQMSTNGSLRQSNGVIYAEPAIPKEYVGYYVGQSPQLLPQYQTGNVPQLSQLRDTPPRTSRRISPELLPPVMPNTSQPSRSPSPLGRNRSHSAVTNPSSTTTGQAPVSQAAQPSVQQPKPEPKLVNHGGPVIVNGSNAGYTPSRSSSMTDTPHAAAHALGVNAPVDTAPTEQVRGLSLDAPMFQTNGAAAYQQPGVPTNGSLPEQTHIAPGAQMSSWPETRDGRNGSTGMTVNSAYSTESTLSNARGQDMSPLNLPPHNGDGGSGPDLSVPLHTSAAPVLSPVEETRTPSPTVSRLPDLSRLAPHRKLAQTTQVANTRLTDENASVPNRDLPHPRPVNANLPHGTGYTSDSGKQHTSANTWQQATRKSHKKNRSITGGKAIAAPKTGGEPIPANETDRKGG